LQFPFSSGFSDINLFNLETQAHLFSYNEHKFGIRDLKYYKNNLFVSLGRENTIKLWDLFSSTSLQTYKLDASIQNCMILFENEFLIGGDNYLFITNFNKKNKQIAVDDKFCISGMINFTDSSHKKYIIAFNHKENQIVKWEVVNE